MASRGAAPNLGDGSGQVFRIQPDSTRYARTPASDHGPSVQGNRRVPNIYAQLPDGKETPSTSSNTSETRALRALRRIERTLFTLAMAIRSDVVSAQPRRTQQGLGQQLAAFISGLMSQGVPTPDEDRRFLGLPDVVPMQQAAMKRLQQCIESAVEASTSEALLKAWMPMALNQMQRSPSCSMPSED
jgi:hypothetical protein